MTRTQIVVVDLDGTLCNSSKREHLAQAGLWDEFHSCLDADEPWSDVKHLVSQMTDDRGYGTYVLGLTGRNERYREATLTWLSKHEIWLDALLMRPDDNYQSDHELKPQMLADRGISKDDVWFILEDRDKVVEAWRNLGYNCWQVRPGGY